MGWSDSPAVARTRARVTRIDSLADMGKSKDRSDQVGSTQIVVRCSRCRHLPVTRFGTTYPEVHRTSQPLGFPSSILPQLEAVREAPTYQCGKTYGVGLKTWFSLIGLLLAVTRHRNQRHQEAGASSEAPNESRPNRAS